MLYIISCTFPSRGSVNRMLVSRLNGFGKLPWIEISEGRLSSVSTTVAAGSYRDNPLHVPTHTTPSVPIVIDSTLLSARPSFTVYVVHVSPSYHVIPFPVPTHKSLSESMAIELTLLSARPSFIVYVVHVSPS
ncbi:hypothetical protein ES703_87263 [subsurface metagenome]